MCKSVFKVRNSSQSLFNPGWEEIKTSNICGFREKKGLLMENGENIDIKHGCDGCSLLGK